MISIVKLDDDCLSCNSCMKGKRDKVDLFELRVGFQPKQAICIRLCKDCLKELKHEIR